MNRFGAFIMFGGDEVVRRNMGSAKIDPHRNKTISVFALCDVPTTAVLQVGKESYAVRDLVRGAINECRMQHGTELPWTIIALAAYLGTNQTWANRHGEAISLEGLCQALTETSAGEGACLGTHALYAVTFVLRVHEQSPILSPEGEEKLKGFLARTLEVLRATQRLSGAWGKDWSMESARAPGVLDAPTELLATGHHLEWIALLPEDISPPPDMVRRAADFLVTMILDAEEETLQQNYTAYSHAGCALRDIFATEWRVVADEMVTAMPP